MNEQKKRMFLIKFPYWLGIAADALWAVALFSPQIFGFLTGVPDFNPDIEVRLIMGIGGTLMTGWTFLLIWAVQKPIERRMVILLTAFPVVFGMFIIALIGFMEGTGSNIWILVKNTLLMITIVTSYILSRRIEKQA